jgi:hypothetical protein
MIGLHTPEGSEMLTLVLPTLVAGRDLADEFVDRLAGDVRGSVVTVDARRLTRGTPSFAAQLTERVLGAGASALVLRGAPEVFVEYVRRAAGDLHATDRLDVRPGAESPVSA